VRLVNGDATSGVVQNLAGGSVTIQPGAADAGADAAGADAPVAEAAQISLDKVAAILLADADPMVSPLSGAAAAWRVWLSDGSSLTVPLATLAEGGQSKLSIGFSPQKTNDADLSAVSCIELLNGPVRWLTQLTPSAVVYHPYLERSFPPRFDHPVDDPTVSIRARFPSFRHGIGVHSYTRLTYAVPEGFGAFRTQFAIERIAGSDMAKADVTVRLLLDGKVAAEFAHVRYGPVADPVNLDVHNARELALEVDYGDNLDAQDRFVWLDPAFVREPAAAHSVP
jgi:NPCBM/NEW2 domain-containing protein